MGRSLSSLLLLPAILLLGCSSAEDVLTIEAQSAVVKVGDRLPLTLLATEVLSGPPEWEVVEMAGGTLLRNAGYQNTFLAPGRAGTYHVAVRGMRSNGHRVRAVQAIQVQPHLQVEPAIARVAPGGSCSFAAKLKGADPAALVWSVEDEDGGVISSTGTYTAPARSGVYRVVATFPGEVPVVSSATVRVE